MKTAVLCVHGIQGSPDQFDWIISALPEDVHAEKLLLPGHGGDVYAFSKSNKQLWQDGVDQALNRLRGEYDRIIYIGHSMGCLLGMLSAVRNSEKIASLILLACPLHVRITKKYIVNNLRALSKAPSDDPFIAAARSAHSVKGRHILEYVLCIGPYIGLFRLIHAANRQLQQLRLPVLAVFSELDEIVGRKSMEIIAKLPLCETYLAKGCGHLFYAQEARREILKKMQKYI